MNKKPITALLRASLTEDLSTTKEFKDLLAALRDAGDKAAKGTAKSVVQLFVLGCVWFLAWTANITKIQIAGTEVANVRVLLVAIPPAFAFVYYRYHCLQGLSNLIEDATDAVLPKAFPTLAEANLADLLSSRSSFYFEALLYRLDPSDGVLSKTARLWAMGLYLGLATIPLAVLAFMLWEVWQDGRMIARVLSSALALLFAVRGLAVFEHSSTLMD